MIYLLNRYLPGVTLVLAVTLFALPEPIRAGEQLFTVIQQQDSTALAKIVAETPADKLAKQLAARNGNGDTPLLAAARRGDLKLFGQLIDAGADPNVVDGNQRDLLNIAVRIGNPELAERAIAAGTDVTRRTSRYQGSALIYASHQGEVEIARMLIAAGAPVDRINNLGWTALLEATILGDGGLAHQQIVAALLAGGADKSIADHDGVTPLEHARNRGHSAVAKLLED